DHLATLARGAGVFVAWLDEEGRVRGAEVAGEALEDLRGDDRAEVPSREVGGVGGRDALGAERAGELGAEEREAAPAGPRAPLRAAEHARIKRARRLQILDGEREVEAGRRGHALDRTGFLRRAHVDRRRDLTASASAASVATSPPTLVSGA